MKSSLKILILTNGMDIGGAETHILELAGALKSLGHQVAVASAGGVYVPRLQELGIPHHTLPLRSSRPDKLAASLMGLAGILREGNYDVVHAHARIPALIARLLHRHMDFAFVTTVHYMFDLSHGLGRLTFWGQKSVAVSDDLGLYLQRNWNIPPENIFVAPNGIDTRRFSPGAGEEGLRRELGLAQDQPTVVHVSRLDADNSALAAQLLIRVAPELRKEAGSIRLIIVGQGDRFDALKARAEALNQAAGEPYIIMNGPRTDIPELLRLADVFVGVSRAALEAMSAGNPVILAGNNGYDGIFTQDKLPAALGNNFTCRGSQPPREELLAADILRLLALSPQQREQLGIYGRQVAEEHCTVRKMAEACVRAYGAALDERRRATVLGVPFDVVTMEEALSRAMDMLEDGRPHMICTPNPEMVMLARQDPRFLDILRTAHMNIPDGVGILWASRFGAVPIRRRVTGYDFTMQLLRQLEHTDHSVYFLGAAPGVAEKAVEKILETFPALKVAGHHHGYFTEEEEPQILHQIQSLRPSLLLVCLGCPRQEKWIAEHMQTLGTRLNIGIGGAFDVMSGSKRRAPGFIIHCGLEWLYRLLAEPTRIRRFGKLPAFVLQVLKEARKK